jgi:hypothetical protein
MIHGHLNYTAISTTLTDTTVLQHANASTPQACPAGNGLS